MEATILYRKETKKHLGLQETVAMRDELNKIQNTKSTRALRKLMNQRESVWSHLHRKVMRIVSKREGIIRWITALGAQIRSDASSDANSEYDGSFGFNERNGISSKQYTLDSWTKWRGERKLLWKNKKAKSKSTALTSQKCGVKIKISEVQRTSRSPRWYCKIRLVYVVRGGRLVLGPFRLSKLGMTPFLVPFSVGMGSFGRSDRSKFRCGSQISDPVLRLSHFLCLKTSKLSIRKTFKNTQWMDQNSCCLRHGFYKRGLLVQRKVHITQMHIFRNFELPYFCMVFSTICGTVVKQNNEAMGSFSRFLGRLGPFWGWGSRNFCFGMRHKIARFYHVLSVVPSVSVESVMDFKWCVKWRVFALCLWAVSCGLSCLFYSKKLS